jgi:hypothetical protein
MAISSSNIINSDPTSSGEVAALAAVDRLRLGEGYSMMPKNSNNMAMERERLSARTIPTRTILGTEDHPPRLLGSSAYRSKQQPMVRPTLAVMVAVEWSWAMSAALTTTVWRPHAATPAAARVVHR